MPLLEFKEKQYIYAHHPTVPYHTLETDQTRFGNPINTFLYYGLEIYENS